jgi:hypothetical protein
MSWTQANDPLCATCATCATTPAIETIIEARKRDLGGFSVGRVLPSARRRLVGPFIFFDHMSQARLEGRPLSAGSWRDRVHSAS